MKKLKIKIMIMAITILSFGVSYASDPDYTLNVQNITNIDASTIQFEIYLKNANPGNVLKYISGQYIFKFDTLFANGGTMTYSLAPGSPSEISDLPATYLPKKFAVRRSELLMSGTPISEDTIKPVISSSGNGTKIITLRLHTSASSFSGQPDLRWKNRIGAGPTTALLVYVNDAVQKVQDSTAHTINSVTKLDVTFVPEGFLYAASINTTRSNIKDKSTITLRSASAPYSIIDADSVQIDSVTLTANCTFNTAPAGNYFVVVQHKNSLETWSANPVSIIAGTNSYDFTSASSNALGNNLVLKLGKWCLYSGDVDQDGVIDLSDLNQTFNDASSFLSGNVVTDLDGDLFVDLSDLNIVFNNAGSFISTIQP